MPGASRNIATVSIDMQRTLKTKNALFHFGPSRDRPVVGRRKRGKGLRISRKIARGSYFFWRRFRKEQDYATRRVVFVCRKMGAYTCLFFLCGRVTRVVETGKYEVEGGVERESVELARDKGKHRDTNVYEKAEIVAMTKLNSPVRNCTGSLSFLVRFLSFFRGLIRSPCVRTCIMPLAGSACICEL